MKCEKCGDTGVLWNYGLELEMECPYCEVEPEPIDEIEEENAA